MFRLGLLISILAVIGCAASGGTPGDEEDSYSRAANSWEGADIREMMAAWPDPNKRYRPPKGGKDGIAWWRHNSWDDQAGFSKYRYHCETVAHFNSAGTITNIDVKRSLNCYRLFNVESMTRQKATLNHAVTESEVGITKKSPTEKV